MKVVRTYSLSANVVKSLEMYSDETGLPKSKIIELAIQNYIGTTNKTTKVVRREFWNEQEQKEQKQPEPIKEEAVESSNILEALKKFK